jgi:dolichol kinase
MRQQGIQAKRQINLLIKEALRKTIHLCAAFVPCMLSRAYIVTLSSIALGMALYCVSEFLRQHKNIALPVIAAITAACARKRDENHFVLGPVTLALGIFLTALFFAPIPASIGIYALAFGDGLASLVGKCFGRIHLPFVPEKTVAGSLACFLAIFIAVFLVTRSAFCALVTAGAGMTLELIPLKDFDNLLIPLGLAALNQFIL